MATHTPKGLHLVHAEMPVHREYAIALEWTADAPPGPGTVPPCPPVKLRPADARA